MTQVRDGLLFLHVSERAKAHEDRLHADKQLLAQPDRGPVTALRYFALDGTDHPSHKAQGSMIRRYTIWRNKHAADERLRGVVTRANVVWHSANSACAPPPVSYCVPSSSPAMTLTSPSDMSRIPAIRRACSKFGLCPRRSMWMVDIDSPAALAISLTGIPR